MEHCSRMQSGTTIAVEWMASRLESKIDFSSELQTQLTPIALNDELNLTKLIISANLNGEVPEPEDNR